MPVMICRFADAAWNHLLVGWICAGALCRRLENRLCDSETFFLKLAAAALNRACREEPPKLIDFAPQFILCATNNLSRSICIFASKQEPPEASFRGVMNEQLLLSRAEYLLKQSARLSICQLR